MAELEADLDVRVIVLTGAGDKAFSAGADISEFGEYRSTPEPRALYAEYEHATTSSLRNSPKFVIARIDGVCGGGGAQPLYYAPPDEYAAAAATPPPPGYSHSYPPPPPDYGTNYP